MNRCEIYHQGLPAEILQQAFKTSNPADVTIEAPCLASVNCLLGLSAPHGPRPGNGMTIGPQPPFAPQSSQRPESFRWGHTAWKMYEKYDKAKDLANLGLGFANFGFSGKYRFTAKGNYSFTGSGSKRLEWRRSHYRPGHKLLARLAIGETFVKRLKWVNMIVVTVSYGYDVGIAEIYGDELEQDLAQKAFFKEVPKELIKGLLTAGVVTLAMGTTGAVVAPLIISLAAGYFIGMAVDWAWDRWVDPNAQAISQLNAAVLGGNRSPVLLP